MTCPFGLLEDDVTAAARNATLSSQPLDRIKSSVILVDLLVRAEQCPWIRRFSSSSSSSTSAAAPQHLTYSAKADNKGVKKKTLRSFPKLTFSSCSSSDKKFSNCTICLAEFVKLCVLPQCGHTFHVACINMWLGSPSS